MLTVEGISSGYGMGLVVKDVSVRVDAGEVVVLLGANGAGKSTLLKTISGVLKPEQGGIFFQGDKIDGAKPHAIVKKGLVQVQEGRGILSQMTVKENLEMGAYLRSDRKGVAEDLEMVFQRFPRIRERHHQNAGTLSGGEQQMLAIGRALMTRPCLLLLDEPSLGLSPNLVDFIFDTIRELSGSGIPILLVEQNAAQALEVANRGYVMETGRIVLEGNNTELLHNEQVRQAYLGQTASAT